MSERTPSDPGDPRDQAIERSLRRLFTPPERVPLPPALAGLTAAPGARAAGRGRRLLLAAGALAAGLAGLLLLVPDAGRERLADELAHGSPAPQAPGPGAEPPLPASTLASPPTASAQAPAPALLERLYADATRGRAAMAVCSAPDELDVLRRDLAERCGQELFLRPTAAGVLQGPFGSAEWPGGTMVTGFPEGPDGAPAVVLAECDGLGLAALGAGPGAGTGVALRTFVARVGDVVLTEITPLEEPRLLAYFDAR